MARHVSFVSDPGRCRPGLWAGLVHTMQRIITVIHFYLLVVASSDTLMSPLLRFIVSPIFSLLSTVQAEYKSRRDAVGGIDHVWLSLSHYEGFNPVCIASFTLGSQPDEQEISARWTTLAAQCPRFACKLTNMGHLFRSPVFVPDPAFAMDNHLMYTSLPEPAGRKELDEFIADLRKKPWDFEKPLWDVYIIQNYRGSGRPGDPDAYAKAAVVARGHHSVSDGQGYMMGYISLTSYADELQRLLSAGMQMMRDAKLGRVLPSKMTPLLKPIDGLYMRLYRPGSQSPAAQLSTAIARLSLRGIYLCATLLEAPRSAYYALRMLVRFLNNFGNVPKTMPYYPGPRVPDKECATTTPVSLEAVKKIQTAFSGAEAGSLMDICVQRGRRYKPLVGHLTLNDVFCTILADVLGHEVLRISPAESGSESILSEDLHGSMLRRPVVIGVPISARPIGDTSLRNISTGVFVYFDADGRLPTDEGELYRRLHRCKDALAFAKHAMIFTATFKMRTWLTGQLPFFMPSPLWPKWLHPFVALWHHKMQASAAAVFTNVPGPSPRTHHSPASEGASGRVNGSPTMSANGDHEASDAVVDFASAPILTWTASPPQMGKNTLALGLMTYNGWACLTICADKVPLDKLSPAQRALQVGPEANAEYTQTATRLARAFERRFAEYVAVSEEILEPEFGIEMTQVFPNGDSTGAEEAPRREAEERPTAETEPKTTTRNEPRKKAQSPKRQKVKPSSRPLDARPPRPRGSAGPEPSAGLCEAKKQLDEGADPLDNALDAVKIWVGCALFLIGLVFLGPVPENSED